MGGRSRRFWSTKFFLRSGKYDGALGVVTGASCCDRLGFLLCDKSGRLYCIHQELHFRKLELTVRYIETANLPTAVADIKSIDPQCLNVIVNCLALDTDPVSSEILCHILRRYGIPSNNHILKNRSNCDSTDIRLKMRILHLLFMFSHN